MSGIYIHIPFCRQRCHYCDFYTTTQIKRKPELLAAINKEIVLRKQWLNTDKVSTIYLGGGTPSLLTSDEIKQIIETIYSNFGVVHKPEITLEANPDDLTKKQIALIKSTPINRLSMGIQSFHNSELEMMNRRHNAEQVYASIKDCQDAGFDNISVDLIYGLPQSTLAQWEYNLEQVKQLNIQHLSAYHLTFEKGTVFDVKRKKGEFFPAKEEESILQFKMLIKWAQENSFDHYEISNFGKEGFISKHNSSYWKQQMYLGVGPAAHSYNINARTWNVSNISSYITKINEGEEAYELETLLDIDKHNEFLITSLRTKWGINLQEFEKQFDPDLKNKLMNRAKPFLEAQNLYLKNNCLVLSDEGVFISDTILADLMLVSNEK